MDMWAPYISVAEQYVHDAEQKICFDKFHVAKYLGDAVDKVRREEQRAQLADGNRSLVKTKYHWLRNPENMDRAESSFFERMKRVAIRTSRAWALKEQAMGLWHYKSRTWARKGWQAWLSWAKRSRLAPMKKVASTIETHLDGILNAVVLQATNAASESINARIQRVKRMDADSGTANASGTRSTSTSAAYNSSRSPTRDPEAPRHESSAKLLRPPRPQLRSTASGIAIWQEAPTSTSCRKSVSPQRCAPSARRGLSSRPAPCASGISIKVGNTNSARRRSSSLHDRCLRKSAFAGLRPKLFAAKQQRSCGRTPCAGRIRPSPLHLSKEHWGGRAKNNEAPRGGTTCKNSHTNKSNMN